TVSEVSNVASVETVDEVSNVASVDVVDTISAVITVSEVSNVASVDTIDALTEIINTVDVSLVGREFDTSNTTISDFDAAITSLQMDTSEKNMYSYYVRNTGSATVIAKLEISPTTENAYFVDDAATAVEIGPGENGVIVPVKYLNYTRLHLTPSDTTTVIAYYNAQS
ncbi:DUF6385 domain-containing protein, partial [Anaerophilus nitritogenes]|uniref:DUF6385 domain-containing protein n=1 Tax=Anaerophilus nitritogenes TaxID=2498136 RepID=UPI0013EAC7B6